MIDAAPTSEADVRSMLSPRSLRRKKKESGLSKKTNAFTMPATGRRPRARKQVVLDGLTGESVPFAANEPNLRDVGSESRPDEWVRDSAGDAEPSRIPDPPSPALASGASMTLDLLGERSLMEAMTLSVTLPFALGWFWWANAIAWRQRWGA